MAELPPQYDPIGATARRAAEETNDPLVADQRNFYKVEKWSKHEQRTEEMRVRLLAIGCRTACRLYCIPQLRRCNRGNARACISHRLRCDGRPSDHLSLVFL